MIGLKRICLTRCEDVQRRCPGRPCSGTIMACQTTLTCPVRSEARLAEAEGEGEARQYATRRGEHADV